MSSFGVGVGVGVGIGVGVNVGVGKGSTGGFAQPVVTVAEQTIGVGFGGNFTTSTPLFQTNFFPDLVQV